jgi:hypothetical protein
MTEKTSTEWLIEANALECDGDYASAARICEGLLDEKAFPDHYFTLARNYFNLAHQGDETFAWRALFSALEGIEHRAKELPQPDVQYAVGIIKWVLDRFSDTHRIDIQSNLPTASCYTTEDAAENDPGIPSLLEDYRQKLETENPTVLINRCFRETPVVVRPGRTNHDVERELRFMLANRFSAAPNGNVANLLSEGHFPVPGGFDLQLYEHYLQTASRAEIRRLEAQARGVPGVMLSCMPKSASEFLCYTLADLLDVPIVRATIGNPLEGVILERWMREIARGGCIMHDHFGARPENLAVLKQCGVEQIHVLIRDPRAVAFSLQNMGEEMGVAETTSDRFGSPSKGDDGPDTSYFCSSVALLSRWVEMWTEASACGIQIKFIRFAELTKDPVSVMGEVLVTSGATEYRDRLVDTLAERGKASNFRSGSDQAWRQRIPAAHLAACTRDTRS